MATPLAAGVNSLVGGTIYEVQAGTEIRVVTPRGVIYQRPKGDGSAEPTSWDRYDSAKEDAGLECNVDSYIKSVVNVDVDIITGVV
jgi:hypothetical protein